MRNNAKKIRRAFRATGSTYLLVQMSGAQRRDEKIVRMDLVSLREAKSVQRLKSAVAVSGTVS
jgi:hypothetical protein